MNLFSNLKSLKLKLTMAFRRHVGFKYTTKTLDKFGLDIEHLSILMKEDFVNIQATGMADLWEAIVENTPVDLGIAQANWQIDSHRNNNVIHGDILDAKRSGTLNRATIFGRLVPEPDPPDVQMLATYDKIHIFNNVDYIAELEAGSSSQTAPGQMVADNVRRMQLEIRNKLKETGLFK